MEENNPHCRNCETALNGDYCASCGQRASVNKVTFKETFGDFVDSFFSVNTPLFLTLKLLFLNPGKLFREYLNGKRKGYYKPVHFFILTTIVYIIVKSLLDYDPISKIPARSEGPTLGLTVEVGRFMFANIDKILFFFVFTMGLSLKVFFYRKHSLAEYTAVAFYLLGVYTILTTINMFFYTYVSESFQPMGILLSLAYFLMALISFFQKDKVLVLFKGLFTYFFAFLLYMALGFGFSFLVIWIKSS